MTLNKSNCKRVYNWNKMIINEEEIVRYLLKLSKNYSPALIDFISRMLIQSSYQRSKFSDLLKDLLPYK